MIVLSLFDYTGNMVRPWADAGYECIILDVQHERNQGWGDHPNIERVGKDVLRYLPPRAEYAAVFAFPPCTHLAVSGARWFAGKGLHALADSIELFARAAEICEWSGAPYLIENPVSTISSYWRKPDYSFDPCEYAGYEGGQDDAYTKKTCLWIGGGFRMPDCRPVVPTQGSKMHLLPPSSERANLRSATPKGFARAVFEANHRARLAEAA